MAALGKFPSVRELNLACYKDWPSVHHDLNNKQAPHWKSVLKHQKEVLSTSGCHSKTKTQYKWQRKNPHPTKTKPHKQKTQAPKFEMPSEIKELDFIIMTENTSLCLNAWGKLTVLIT